ncbi:hypothetical protein [Streptomyces sp. NPDC086010]|uniref:hypothetical protein n=1 Tax=Streptomyces sp. NPDC086010 TaxID=3365745 RepID=UPI0037D690D7
MTKSAARATARSKSGPTKNSSIALPSPHRRVVGQKDVQEPSDALLVGRRRDAQQDDRPAQRAVVEVVQQALDGRDDDRHLLGAQPGALRQPRDVPQRPEEPSPVLGGQRRQQRDELADDLRGELAEVSQESPTRLVVRPEQSQSLGEHPGGSRGRRRASSTSARRSAPAARHCTATARSAVPRPGSRRR